MRPNGWEKLFMDDQILQDTEYANTPCKSM